MRKRRSFVLGAALMLALLAFIGVSIRSQWLPAEPVYQGQPLSYWLPHATMENPNGVHYNHDHYREALAAAGRQTMPFILAKLRKSDSTLADRYRKLFPRLPTWLSRHLPQPRPPDYFPQDAAAGLLCLGAAAIPSLVEAMSDGNPAVREAAAQALCGFSGGALSVSDSAEVFGRAIKDSDASVRLFAAFGLSRLGPAASNSVPALIQALSSPETNREAGKVFFVHHAAAFALAAIGRPARDAIPVLKKLLPTEDANTQCGFTNALNALESPPADPPNPPSLTREVFLPPTPSGRLELWLRADAGVVTNAYGRVREWQDQSENRNNAGQPCEASGPLLVFPPALGGRPAIRFDGVSVFGRASWGPGFPTTIGSNLKGAGQVNVPNAMTTFCVHLLARPSTVENTLWIVGEANPPMYGQCRGDMVIGGVMRFTTWAYDYGTPFFVPPGRFRIRTDRLNERLTTVEMFDTTPEATLKFTSTVSRAQSPRPGYLIGGFDPDETYGRNWNGDIAELLIYQGALEDADVQAVTDYLRKKYFP